ncbi:carbohydrate kinase [Cryobacterium sp. MLB-32]|uniref:carbohydrate kinase family protein n=1 Tax=Cryobacterium sp. MLB-32 TaxID=1529318 RepID=UPI000AB5D805|nr:carbohydrate kinase [Cryobacterium sp. MLB-32]
MNSTPEIIVIGEALTDIVETDGGTAEFAGGSPMNVAIGLARLGHEVQLVTRIGSDTRGDEITRHVEESGARIFPGSVIDEPQSTAKAVLDHAGAATYEFDIRWSLDFVDTLPAVRVLHTGSIASFLAPGAADVRRLLAAAGTETIVTFDPNIRPTLLESAAVTRPVVEDLATLAGIVKLSDEDAEWLYGDTPLDQVLDRLLDLGPALVIITRGGDGAILATASDRVIEPGVTVEVADTIGAGDSFMSALIHHVAGMLAGGVTPSAIRDGSAFDRGELERLGAFAAACAAITVSRKGANPPTLAEL